MAAFSIKVVIVPWERRCVLNRRTPEQREVIDSLIPERAEEFSTASAACLMVKTESFDAVGGFDEDGRCLTTWLPPVKESHQKMSSLPIPDYPS